MLLVADAAGLQRFPHRARSPDGANNNGGAKRQRGHPGTARFAGIEDFIDGFKHQRDEPNSQ